MPLLLTADSELRQVQRDHDAASKKINELHAEKERVNRQVSVVGGSRALSAQDT